MLPRKRPIGRPSLFATELGDEICSRIADGESLRSICGEADMLDKATVLGGCLRKETRIFATNTTARVRLKRTVLSTTFF